MPHHSSQHADEILEAPLSDVGTSGLAPRTHNLPPETELPGSVYLITVLCYAAILAAMWMTFSGYGVALFMVAISTVFGIVYFGLSGLLGRMERQRHREATSELGRVADLRQFLRGEFATSTGRVSGRQALIQIALIPFVQACAVVVVGLIIVSNR